MPSRDEIVLRFLTTLPTTVCQFQSREHDVVISPCGILLSNKLFDDPAPAFQSLISPLDVKVSIRTSTYNNVPMGVQLHRY